MKHEILYFVDYNTGDILTGVFKKTFRKNGDEIKSRKTFTVNFKAKRKLDDISELSFLSIKKEIIDSIVESVKSNRKGIDTFMVVWGTRKFSNGDSGTSEFPYFVLSTIENAKYVSKNYVLPKVIEEKLATIQTIKNEFAKLLSELNELEKMKQEL